MISFCQFIRPRPGQFCPGTVIIHFFHRTPQLLLGRIHRLFFPALHPFQLMFSGREITILVSGRDMAPTAYTLP